MRRQVSALLSGLLIVLAVCAYAQAPAGDNFLVGATALVYNHPEYDSVAIVEFPFLFNRANLDFFRADSLDSTLTGRVFAQVVLYDTLAQPTESTSTYFVVAAPVQNDRSSKSVMIFNRLGMLVHPGTYSARVTVIDAVSKRSGDHFIDPFVVSKPQHVKLQLAGPSLAYSVKYITDSAAAEQDRLVRNGFRTLTNPSGIFTTEDSTIAVYAELYNLSETSQAEPKFRVAIRATDTLGNTVQDFGYAMRSKPGTSAVIHESVAIKNWRPGVYRLVVAASDPATAQSDSVVMPFIVATLQGEETQVAARELVDPFDSLSLKDRINITHYALSEDQQAALSRLNDQGKINFLEQFWRDHDVNPSTPVIENRAEMVERYRFANLNFSRFEGKTDGWSSDRGRIYMTYGRWDQRDDVPAPRQGDPFSIWFYRGIKEGKLFVFQDENGDNEYRLVHSNVPGEPFDKGWEERSKEEMLEIR